MTSSATSIRVLLVDDSELVRQGVKTVLQSDARITLAGEAATASDAIVACRSLEPDVVLLDIRLPDGSGIDVCNVIRASPTPPKVIILTSHLSDSLIYKAITAGAEGYLMKEIDPTGLIDAILRVSAGGTILSPDLTARVMGLVRAGAQPSPLDAINALSAQEKRVLAGAAKGQTNKEIAAELTLSDNTVKNYLGSVFEKLGVQRRSQAVALYIRTKSDSAD